MKIQSFPKISPPLTKIHFNNEDDNNNNDEDWGMNPNPDGWHPNWSLVGGCALAGATAGVGLGTLGGYALAASPVPLQIVGTLVGTYVGANIGFAFPLKD